MIASGGPAARPRELRVAVMFLTRLPVGRMTGDVPTIAASAWAWPLAGALVGLVMAVSYGLADWFGMPGVVAALLAVAAGVLATGGLHEDGLADLADGLGGGRDREHKLSIMRDSRIGSYGVLVLVLSIGLRVAAIAEIGTEGLVLPALIALAAASRCGLPMFLHFVPPARDDGLGKSAVQIGIGRAIVSVLVGLSLLLLLGLMTAMAIALGIWLMSLGLAWIVLRQIGGQTGDVMGGLQQLCEVNGWLVLVALS